MSDTTVKQAADRSNTIESSRVELSKFLMHCIVRENYNCIQLKRMRRTGKRISRISVRTVRKGNFREWLRMEIKTEPLNREILKKQVPADRIR